MDDKNKTDPSFENLHNWTLDKHGTLIKRKNGGRGGYWKVVRDLEREFQLVFKRPFELADINPDTATVLLLRYKREGKRMRFLRSRLDWFKQRSQVAAALGWSKPADYSDITIARQTDWSENMLGVPMPPPMEERAGDGTKSSMSLEHLLDEHYIPARLVGKSENTVRLYRITIRTFTRWLGREAVVGDLNTATVAKFLRWQLECTQRSPHTTEKDRTQLTAFWNFCAKRGWRPDFPDISAINCPEPAPDAWTDEELVAMFDTAAKAEGKVGSVEAGQFWVALLSVIYDTGERISAVMELKRDDIGPDVWLTIRGQHRKGKTRDRQYKLRQITLERLDAIKVPGQAKVFEWPWCGAMLWRKFGDLLKDAGLPANRRTKFHKIRRSSATHFAAAGGNATAFLDHSSTRVTKAYLDRRVISEQFPADICRGVGEKDAPKPEPEPSDDAESFRQFQEFQEFQKRQQGRDAG